MRQPSPRVSILIPNFNNGRQSTTSGDVDLLGDLFRSLRETLEDDPTPLEILVCDDGSTDDSLETCRAWAEQTWRGGEPFLQLDEWTHCGVLSRVANHLTRKARGEFCVRLDGDIVCHTPMWVSKLCRIFDEGPPDLGIVGPKQLAVDGTIHAMGDWILHPRGNHHIGQGMPRHALTRAVECDHVMGCFYCHRRQIWDDLGGYDESFLRGQTIDFGLMARKAGWRCIATPAIEFTHRHALRRMRATTADSSDGIVTSLARFREKWGFDRIAPDLEIVAARYHGTPLLWNARFFPLSSSADAGVSAGQTVSFDQSDWQRFATDESCQSRIRMHLEWINAYETQFGKPYRTLHWNCREGLLAHLLAKNDRLCIGVDHDPACVALARQVTARERYLSAKPQFFHQLPGDEMPVEPQSVDLILLMNVIERHPNPVGLFAMCHRVLRPGGHLLIASPERQRAFDQDADAVHAYRLHELVQQLHATRRFVFKARMKHALSGGQMAIVAEAVANDKAPGHSSAESASRKMAESVS